MHIPPEDHAWDCERQHVSEDELKRMSVERADAHCLTVLMVKLVDPPVEVRPMQDPVTQGKEKVLNPHAEDNLPHKSPCVWQVLNSKGVLNIKLIFNREESSGSWDQDKVIK